MARSPYLEALSRLPALRGCTAREVEELGRLVEVVMVPAGAALPSPRPGDLVVGVDATRVLVIDRRARGRVLELAPDLAGGRAAKGGVTPAGTEHRVRASVGASTRCVDARPEVRVVVSAGARNGTAYVPTVGPVPSNAEA